MKRTRAMSLLLVGVLALTGCSAAGTTDTGSATTTASSTSTAQTLSTVDTTDMFSSRDMEVGYDEETSANITLSGDSASSDSDAVRIDGSTITITDEGTYILSGTLSDGQIIVNAEDSDKVQLVLNGVSITSSTSAAIYVAQADKVFVTTASGSENALINGGEYIAIDDNNIDSVIFSKSDLTLNGEGSLTIDAKAGHGIVSKDDLVMTSGIYTITAASQGVSGKDSVRIADGTYTITSGKDAIHAENTDDANKGFVYIAGGTFTVQADGDGISASASVQIDDGKFSITTGEGSASVSMKTEQMGDPRQQQNQTENTDTDTDSTSQKGIKSGTTLTINGGTFETDTVDDSIHAGGNIAVADGTFTLKTGDDAMHSDANVTIQGGAFSIPYCYEGIEGLTVTIDNGTFDITANDDGINAADGSATGNRPGEANDNCSITVNGGELTIVSDGDCLDSNGALTIAGGTLNLTCNGNGNTALDCDGTYANTGGSVTTNDGSEENPNEMGGGQSTPNNQSGQGGPNGGNPPSGGTPQQKDGETT